MLVMTRQDDSASISEIHRWGPLYGFIEYPVETRGSNGYDVHASDEFSQRHDGPRVILQHMLCLRNRRLAGHESTGDPSKYLHRPGVIRITAIDGSLERSSVNDDGSSGRDAGGAFHSENLSVAGVLRLQRHRR